MPDTVFSLEAIVKKVKTNSDHLLNAIDVLNEIIEDVSERDNGNPARIEQSVNAHLSGLSSLLTEVVTLVTVIAVNIEVWGVITGSSFMLGSIEWLSTVVEVDDGAGKSTLTVNQDTIAAIFDVFDVGDDLKITNAEDPRHNGEYTVSAVTDQKLTFDATMLGDDNANDETMIITLIRR